MVAFGIKTSGAALLRGLHQIIGDIDEFGLAFVDDLERNLTIICDA